MRSPEDLAAIWLAQFRYDIGAIDRADIAALLRQRDAEWQERLKEERGRAFSAGVKAAGKWSATFITGQPERLDEAYEAFAAARRAAVEGAEGVGEEQPCESP